MSNVEIVRLNACFLQDFEVEGVKNDKCAKKDSGKTNVYAYERYFVSKVDFLKKRRNFEKYVLFRTGKTRNFL